MSESEPGHSRELGLKLTGVVFAGRRIPTPADDGVNQSYTHMSIRDVSYG